MYENLNLKKLNIWLLLVGVPPDIENRGTFWHLNITTSSHSEEALTIHTTNTFLLIAFKHFEGKLDGSRSFSNISETNPEVFMYYIHRCIMVSMDQYFFTIDDYEGKFHKKVNYSLVEGNSFSSNVSSSSPISLITKQFLQASLV